MNNISLLPHLKSLDGERTDSENNVSKEQDTDAPIATGIVENSKKESDDKQKGCGDCMNCYLC